MIRPAPAHDCVGRICFVTSLTFMLLSVCIIEDLLYIECYVIPNLTCVSLLSAQQKGKCPGL